MKTNEFYEYALFDFQFQTIHKDVEFIRYAYCITDAIGDIGGVLDLLLAVAGVFLYPYNDHNFNVSLMKNLYKVKSTEGFRESKIKVN